MPQTLINATFIWFGGFLRIEVFMIDLNRGGLSQFSPRHFLGNFGDAAENAAGGPVVCPILASVSKPAKAEDEHEHLWSPTIASSLQHAF